MCNSHEPPIEVKRTESSDNVLILARKALLSTGSELWLEKVAAGANDDPNVE